MAVTKLLGLIIVVTVLSGLWFLVTDNTPEVEPAPKKKPPRKKSAPRKKKK